MSTQSTTPNPTPNTQHPTPNTQHPTPNPLLAQFRAVQNEDAPRHLNILVYGASGLGKTVLGATGPGPVLFLDLDDGMTSVRSPTRQLVDELQIDTKNIFVERVRNYNDLKRTLVKLNQLRNSPQFFGTVVVDNLTVAQSICMQERISGDESVSVDKLPERQDWGILLQRMRAIVRLIRDLPCTSYFIAMEQEKDGHIGPALQGAMFRELPAMLDVVARYLLVSKTVDDGKGGTTEQELRYLQCHPSAAVPGRSLAVIAKNRSGRLARFERPHLRHLIEKVFPTEGDNP